VAHTPSFEDRRKSSARVLRTDDGVQTTSAFVRIVTPLAAGSGAEFKLLQSWGDCGNATPGVGPRLMSRAAKPDRSHNRT
jgi:hypothetical protein